MFKTFHKINTLKAILFRALIFFPFEIFGYLNVFSFFSNKEYTKKSIAFQAYNPQIAQVFLPIIRELQKNNKIDIFFVIMFHPYHGFEGLKKTRGYALDHLGIDENNIVNVWQTYWKNFNCLICADVYAKFPLVKTKKILLPHGAGLMTRWVSKSILRKTVSDFDNYFVCGEHDLDQVREFTDHSTKLQVTGFPFVDELAAYPPIDRHNVLLKMKCDGSKKTVVYAPSWGHTYNYGDILSQNFREVMDCLIAKDVNVLVKLHSASFVKGQSLGVCWKERVDLYRGVENVYIIDEICDNPWFAVSDLLITDISSRSFNFMITDNPVIIYGVPQSVSKAVVERKRMEKIQEAASVVFTPIELSDAIDKCLHAPQVKSVARKKVVDEVFANLGSATHAVTRKLIEEMGVAS